MVRVANYNHMQTVPTFFLFLSLSFSWLTRAHLSLSLTRTLSLPPLAYARVFSTCQWCLFLSVSFALSLSVFLRLSPSHARTHTYTHTLSLSLSWLTQASSPTCQWRRSSWSSSWFAWWWRSHATASTRLCWTPRVRPCMICLVSRTCFTNDIHNM